MEYLTSMKTSLFIPILTISLFTSTVHASQIYDLESEATKPKSRSSSASDHSSNSSSSDSSSDNSLGGIVGVAAGGFLVAIFMSAAEAGIRGMAFAGDNSMQRYQRDEPETTDAEELKVVQDLAATNRMSATEYTEFQHQGYKNTLFRTDGDPILPALRLSSQWLSGADDINAQLFRAEAGYGLIGVSYSQNKLQEEGDSLTLSNLLVHYRMSLSNDLSWHLAYGRGKMNGKQEHDGSVLAMPIRYRYHKDWHFEYYPVWSSYEGGSLAEHQFSFNYHYNYIGATLGYKTWSAGTASVDGLFTGLYLSF